MQYWWQVISLIRQILIGMTKSLLSALFGAFCNIYQYRSLFGHEHATPIYSSNSFQQVLQSTFHDNQVINDCCVKQLLRTLMAWHFIWKWGETTVCYWRWSPITYPVLNKGETSWQICQTSLLPHFVIVTRKNRSLRQMARTDLPHILGSLLSLPPLEWFGCHPKWPYILTAILQCQLSAVEV